MAPSLRPALSSFLGQIGPETSVVFLVHEAARRDAEALVCDAGLGGRARIIPVDDGLPLVIWAQDALVAGADASGSCLYPAAKLDQRLRPAFEGAARAAGLQLRETSGVPDGGNVVVGSETVFVGADDWDGGRVARLFVPGNRLVEVSASLGVPVEETRPAVRNGEDWGVVYHHGNRPGTRQPVFHIDMFLTAAGRSGDGRERVLVGDPALAASILGHAPLAHALQDHFDDIAASLGTAGFQVIRNPLPMVWCHRPQDRERDWYFASANNAVVQAGDGVEPIVWLPAYGNGNWPGLAATDEANAGIWRSLGFEVRVVENCGPLAENFGGLNCLVKVLRRVPRAI